ncbi:MAG: hypothetical protein FJ206_15850 [Gemmatimonadetes bacterium]|nr:hypothetical protein [Gemmatimonadota bacterium]
MGALIAVLLTLVMAVACTRQPAALGAAHATALGDSARAFLAEFTRLSAAAQWDSLSQLYSARSDFRFLESGEVRYASAGAIREALRGVPAGTRIRTEYTDVAVQPIAPGLAGVSALFSTRFVDSAGGGFGFAGAISLTLQRESAGWRIIAGHSSAPVRRGP